MTTLNLNTKATSQVTQLFGVDVETITDLQLTNAAKQVKRVINQAKETAQGLNSAKLDGDISKLEDGLKAIVRILDDDEINKPVKSVKEPAFDFECDALKTRGQIFGVFTDELTSNGLREAMATLKGEITKEKEINEGLNSKRLEDIISTNERSLKGLVRVFDGLKD